MFALKWETMAIWRVMPPKAQLTIYLGFNMASLRLQMSSSGRLSGENYYSASAE
jgi:hypothetical protein